MKSTVDLLLAPIGAQFLKQAQSQPSELIGQSAWTVEDHRDRSASGAQEASESLYYPNRGTLAATPRLGASDACDRPVTPAKPDENN